MTSVWMMLLRLSLVSQEITCETPYNSVSESATALTKQEAVKRAETKLSQQLDDKLARSNLDEYSRWLNHLHTAQPEICLQPTSEGLTAHVWFETPMNTAEASPTSALSLRDVAGILSPLQ